jgi:uncharacterized protein YkwD
MIRLLLAAGLYALAACGTTGGTAAVSRVEGTTQLLGGDFATDLNAFRAAQGQGSVQPNAQLTRVAQRHADDMVKRGYFSHQSRGGPNGDTLTKRLVSGGCNSRAGAENIAQGQTSEAAVFNAWANSAGHRRNMLGAPYAAYGLGRVGNTWVLVLSSGC